MAPTDEQFRAILGGDMPSETLERLRALLGLPSSACSLPRRARWKQGESEPEIILWQQFEGQYLCSVFPRGQILCLDHFDILEANDQEQERHA